jgi:DhnA family fructose-bisphosphate aldolase class Ia
VACSPAQRGLVAQYAADYPDINYLVKMNSKSHLVKTSQDPAKHQDDPYSPQLYDIQTVADLRDNGVNVVGIGYTIYVGSEYESQMMMEAGQLIADAHTLGLIVVCGSTPAARRFQTRRTRT